MKTNERTLQMINGFMDMHDKGMSIQEIAEYYRLSVVTVYARLSEIAEKNGVTRESLLHAVHSPHVGGVWGYRNIPKTDTTEVEAKFSEVQVELSDLISTIGTMLDEMKMEELV